jgi:hypothetical protein
LASSLNKNSNKIRINLKTEINENKNNNDNSSYYSKKFSENEKKSNISKKDINLKKTELKSEKLKRKKRKRTTFEVDSSLYESINQSDPITEKRYSKRTIAKIDLDNIVQRKENIMIPKYRFFYMNLDETGFSDDESDNTSNYYLKLHEPFELEERRILDEYFKDMEKNYPKKRKSKRLANRRKILNTEIVIEIEI